MDNLVVHPGHFASGRPQISKKIPERIFTFTGDNHIYVWFLAHPLWK
jgi:hypothetical protein